MSDSPPLYSSEWFAQNPEHDPRVTDDPAVPPQPFPGNTVNAPGEGGAGGNTGPTRSDLRGRARQLHPWLPPDLLRTFVDSWVETGNPQQALAEMRQSSAYEQNFPGIFREDGTMRMGEREYLATRARMEQHIAAYDVNPDVFQDNITRAIEGELSPQEMRQRLSAQWNRVVEGADATRQEFGRFYGIDEMSDEALFGMSLDPDVGRDVLERRISVSEVAGGYRETGWQRSQERIRQLMEQGVDTRQAALEQSRQIQRQQTSFDALGRRHNEGPFSRRDVEQATVFGEESERRRMERAMEAESAMFTPAAGFRRNERGDLEGLSER